MRYELVPEKDEIYGFLTGKKLDKLKVVAGRTREITRMDEFTVYRWVEEAAAKGKKKVPSKWCE